MAQHSSKRAKGAGPLPPPLLTAGGSGRCLTRCTLRAVLDRSTRCLLRWTTPSRALPPARVQTPGAEPTPAGFAILKIPM